MESLTPDAVWRALEQVEDPEIPVVSVVELGIVRDVAVAGKTVVVTITPTFSGCPALSVIAARIRERLRQLGPDRVEVQTTLHPPWSSDWIRAEARQKLKEFGLALPDIHGGALEQALLRAPGCPYCDSEDTTLKNPFGPTLCREIHFCNHCQQPFERFKPL